MRLLMIVFAIVLAGCESTPEPMPETPSPYLACAPHNTDELVACPMHWAPVCGQLATGTWQTYANDCDACANGAKQYLPDACDFVDPELITND